MGHQKIGWTNIGYNKLCVGFRPIIKYQIVHQIQISQIAGPYMSPIRADGVKESSAARESEF